MFNFLGTFGILFMDLVILCTGHQLPQILRRLQMY